MWVGLPIVIGTELVEDQGMKHLFTMIQNIITYTFLALACSYVVYRTYASIRKKQACSKCALMEAAKKNNKNH